MTEKEKNDSFKNICEACAGYSEKYFHPCDTCEWNFELKEKQNIADREQKGKQHE